MKQINVRNKNHLNIFGDQLDLYLKNKSSDCILYSQDGGIFKIHKEIFGQTSFLREILSTNENCCETLEVFCPCTEQELWYLVNFLYHGEILCEKKNDLMKAQENLSKIFGFSGNLSLKNSNKGENTRMTKIKISTISEFSADTNSEVKR